ncbi:50S ribosomal protein L21 [Phyllobacterium bourgognense]|uniref:Large ribosomal subunit protein bL21 n=1 Tax=Phyllobacterium bourgognense TaxID=314236 RepID=A0A368YLG3_9HYPH|nr:50S ribosomal protein L21 [Phyllobacterium bourgognense]RCW80358.1 LSU ribosomal protein L21P [Phyllobacterium bourgognense]
MFAVIKTGGKQYRVAANDLLKVEKVAGNAGDIVEFAEVLMVGVGADATIGAPVVGGALVTAEVVEQGRARKVIAFKKRRRQNSKRTRGHRQELTTIRISEILTDGAKPSKKAAEKPVKKEAAPKAEAAAADVVADSGETKAAPKAKAAPKKAAAKAEKPASGE